MARKKSNYNIKQLERELKYLVEFVVQEKDEFDSSFVKYCELALFNKNTMTAMRLAAMIGLIQGYLYGMSKNMLEFDPTNNKRIFFKDGDE